MLKLLKLFAWLILGAALLGGLDQFLLRVPLDVPGFSQGQTFYIDFRGRLLGLLGIQPATQKPQPSIEQVIETSKQPRKTATKAPRRYLYVDDSGVLQFADGLEQVPPQYRQRAQPLAE